MCTAEAAASTLPVLEGPLDEGWAAEWLHLAARCELGVNMAAQALPKIIAIHAKYCMHLYELCDI